MALAAIMHETPATLACVADPLRAWQNERRVFDIVEIGRVAEDARRLVNREHGWPDRPTVLADPHLREPSLDMLARHPRLHGRATSLLGGPVRLAWTSLTCGTLVRIRPSRTPQSAVFVIALAARPEAPMGTISYGIEPYPETRFDWPFVVVYGRVADGAIGADGMVADDSLWPDAVIVAG